ncbi:hypothetical protein ACE103_16310 [Bradyrhizobium sp. ma5]|uniref:hypothetical protein n=1 Tax=Bradyrhizobium sp. ma5 TaxID=3344828 RepID=UPI0035D41AE9
MRVFQRNECLKSLKRLQNRRICRWVADCAIDKVRDRFGWDAIGYGSAALEVFRSVPDDFRKLAEKDL